MRIGDCLTSNALELPHSEAIVFKDRRITYAEYHRESDRAAAGMLARGVKKGDRVGIYLSSCPEFLFTYMAAAKIGAIAVPVSWRFTPKEVKFVLEDAGVSFLVMGEGFSGMDFIGTIQSLGGTIPSPDHIVLFGRERSLEGALRWDDLLSEPAASLDDAKAKVTGEDPVLFLYTSGTTGVPKAAVLTHKNLCSYAVGMMKASGLEHGDAILLNVPLNHVGGAVMAVMSALAKGNKLVVMDSFVPEETLQVIERERVAVMGQVPAQYALELLSPNVGTFNLGSIRIAIVSGQSCPPELISQIKEKMGVLPRNAYGLTEVSGAITFTHPDHGPEKLQSTVGRPMEGIDLAILDESGNTLPGGKVGEIAVRGEPVMKGYWRRDAENDIVFDRNGYLHTGDMGMLDKDGFLVMSGRKKEMYIRGGENVYPPEVEEVLTKHPDVLFCAVVGRPDSVMGEVGRAYVVLRPGASADTGSVRSFAAEHLAAYKVPVDVIFRDQLPFTPVGKVRKLDLYREIEEEFKRHR
ncbi:MAG TPA: AMP-binding protein [Desulfomonilia bacterium]|nr:AMP-binding protein [Desulfomonilia bacterium]